MRMRSCKRLGWLVYAVLVFAAALASCTGVDADGSDTAGGMHVLLSVELGLDELSDAKILGRVPEDVRGAPDSLSDRGPVRVRWIDEASGETLKAGRLEDPRWMRSETFHLDGRVESMRRRTAVRVHLLLPPPSGTGILRVRFKRSDGTVTTQSLHVPVPPPRESEESEP